VVDQHVTPVTESIQLIGLRLDTPSLLKILMVYFDPKSFHICLINTRKYLIDRIAQMMKLNWGFLYTPFEGKK